MNDRYKNIEFQVVKLPPFSDSKKQTFAIKALVRHYFWGIPLKPWVRYAGYLGCYDTCLLDTNFGLRTPQNAARFSDEESAKEVAKLCHERYAEGETSVTEKIVFSTNPAKTILLEAPSKGIPAEVFDKRVELFRQLLNTIPGSVGERTLLDQLEKNSNETRND